MKKGIVLVLALCLILSGCTRSLADYDVLQVPDRVQFVTGEYLKQYEAEEASRDYPTSGGVKFSGKNLLLDGALELYYARMLNTTSVDISYELEVLSGEGWLYLVDHTGVYRGILAGSGKGKLEIPLGIGYSYLYLAGEELVCNFSYTVGKEKDRTALWAGGWLTLPENYSMSRPETIWEDEHTDARVEYYASMLPQGSYELVCSTGMGIQDQFEVGSGGEVRLRDLAGAAVLILSPYFYSTDSQYDPINDGPPYILDRPHLRLRERDISWDLQYYEGSASLVLVNGGETMVLAEQPGAGSLSITLNDGVSYIYVQNTTEEPMDVKVELAIKRPDK